MVRKINDQIMLLDRAFLDPLAFPDKYAFRYGKVALLKKALVFRNVTKMIENCFF